MVKTTQTWGAKQPLVKKYDNVPSSSWTRCFLDWTFYSHRLLIMSFPLEPVFLLAGQSNMARRCDEKDLPGNLLETRNPVCQAWTYPFVFAGRTILTLESLMVATRMENGDLYNVSIHQDWDETFSDPSSLLTNSGSWECGWASLSVIPFRDVYQ